MRKNVSFKYLAFIIAFVLAIQSCNIIVFAENETINNENPSYEVTTTPSGLMQIETKNTSYLFVPEKREFFESLASNKKTSKSLRAGNLSIDITQATVNVGDSVLITVEAPVNLTGFTASVEVLDGPLDALIGHPVDYIGNVGLVEITGITPGKFMITIAGYDNNLAYYEAIAILF